MWGGNRGIWPGSQELERMKANRILRDTGRDDIHKVFFRLFRMK
jgi:hypothetical protein